MASRCDKPGCACGSLVLDAYTPGRLPPMVVEPPTASSSRPRRRVQVGMYGELTWVEEKPRSSDRKRSPKTPSSASPVVRNHSSPRLPSITEEAQRPPRTTSLLGIGAPRPQHSRRVVSEPRYHHGHSHGHGHGHGHGHDHAAHHLGHRRGLAPPELAIAWDESSPSSARSSGQGSAYTDHSGYDYDTYPDSYDEHTPPLSASDSPRTPGTPEELLLSPPDSLHSSPHGSPNGSPNGSLHRAPAWTSHAKAGYV
ncbi:uncharacterized protein EHS24_000461 [Apiotrichum porosum]|uniref:Uncharacterized protein n=1 Tax=Apiotrichum porosum TaxID=105984 RepID=A0A427Y9V2_9TREE|nr:uncharacterized protein EHS24_000461 [Apiotrichum porosum]RSH87939.1 hypothetical protein EHS24_000461 [Apiotrichum porosum]